MKMEALCFFFSIIRSKTSVVQFMQGKAPPHELLWNATLGIDMSLVALSQLTNVDESKRW